MEFIDFCKAHGVLLDSHPPLGRWSRYPTEDKPTKRNGAVKFMGDHGFVQNHAVDLDVSLWRTENPHSIDTRRMRELVQGAEQERLRLQQQAANKATGILNRCVQGYHPYMKAKGFVEEPVNILVQDGVQLMVVPMRAEGRLVGCQIIDEDGNKKFLYGQKSGGAQYILDNKGDHFFCEGYATGLSIRHALKLLKRRYVIHICFSANNMQKVAKSVGSGWVIADNDESATGLSVARATGLSYWMSDRVGEDFNDYWRRVGGLAAAMALQRLTARVA